MKIIEGTNVIYLFNVNRLLRRLVTWFQIVFLMEKSCKTSFHFLTNYIC